MGSSREPQRHARSALGDWGSQPPRSAVTRQLAAQQTAPPAAAEGKRAPARKNTRAWCHGKPGTAHARGFAVTGHCTPWPACCWAPRWNLDTRKLAVAWACCHREVCTECGKVLREPWQLADEECPAWPGSRSQRIAAETETAARQERQDAAAQARRRRPVITGPQGYRRRRAQR